MKKLVGLFLMISVIAFGLNFHGHQSLNGLGNTTLFTAPATGAYFIQGNLTLPQLPAGSSSPSQVVALLYKNNATEVYRGATGASGFAMPALSLVPSDVVKVALSSTAAIDQGLNVIKGDVFFGNAQ